MKRTGLIALVFGLLIILTAGLNNIEKEKMGEFGEVKITANKTDKAIESSWSPMIGIVVMAVGVVIFMVEKRK